LFVCRAAQSRLVRMSESNSPIPASTLEYYQTLPVAAYRPPRPRYWLHVLLLLGTFFTTLVMGARMQYNFDHNLPALSIIDDSLPYFPANWLFSHPDRLLAGWPFAAAVMLFFLTHEMGHYVCCRLYGIRATLPFFIPVPTPIGTMGAVILIRSRIRSRSALFDVGIAGPLAGFVVAVALLILSLSWAKPAVTVANAGDIQIGLPIIFHLSHRLLGLIVPLNGTAKLPLSRVLLHPVSIAAWVGMYATALNLLPSGQLDGGHIVYALTPRVHRVISWLTVVGLAFIGRFNYGWWVWGALITVMNIFTLRHEQAPHFPELPEDRWGLALVAALILFLSFTISPFQAS
jgi:membrane-associated protease RseP (regulator of RpoE activity)